MEETTGEGTGDRVEAAALPAPSPRGIAHRGAVKWVSLAGMGGNSVRGGRGRFVPVEAVAEEPPIWLGAQTKGFG